MSRTQMLEAAAFCRRQTGRLSPFCGDAHVRSTAWSRVRTSAGAGRIDIVQTIEDIFDSDPPRDVTDSLFQRGVKQRRSGNATSVTGIGVFAVAVANSERRI